ncbi:hypothetical protein JCM11491_001023 [Sporobolomyces phaffii]
MADDRFTWIHDHARLTRLIPGDDGDDDDDDMLEWDLPDDDILVPSHLVPPFHAEDDETLLPSDTHPSYPYGNPYRVTPGSLATSTSTSTVTRVPHRVAAGSTRSAALATSLPSLELPHLFALTAFGDPKERTWHEQHLAGLFGPKTRREQEDDDDERDRHVNTHGDAGPPAGQNAADDDGDGDGDSQTESDLADDDLDPDDPERAEVASANDD